MNQSKTPKPTDAPDALWTWDAPQPDAPTARRGRSAPPVPPVPTRLAYALAAVAARALPALREDDRPECRFLRRQLDMVTPGDLRRALETGEAVDWAATLLAYLRRPHPDDAPLFALARELGLSLPETLAVALAHGVEVEALAGRALAWAQEPFGGSRPTLALAVEAFGGVAPPGEDARDLILDGPALRSGLLALPGEPAPFPERPLLVPAELGPALRGRDGVWPGVTVGADDAPSSPLPPSFLAEAERQARALSAAPDRAAAALALRAASPAEGRLLAAHMARTLGLRAAFLDDSAAPSAGAAFALPPGLEPWLILRGLLPVFVRDSAPGERRALPAFAFYSDPVLALGGPEGGFERGGEPVPDWRPALPGPDERRELWRIALSVGETSKEQETSVAYTADTLAREHRHGPARVASVARLARRFAALDGRNSPGEADIRAALRAGEGTGLEALAQPLPEEIPDSALVLSPGVRAQLDGLLLRCRVRDALADGLGASASARYHPGVRALFVGPSGTGKTLAGGWLATKLGLPLFRVDLAAVTSKYIGETEKNLAQLLARAEQTEVVLLFDEADSLFGKRTDTRDSNDRFANAQTNYLLQRIETFDGIALLTSNGRGRFDPAFTRRLDFIIEFPLPGPEERRGLWESHLGSGQALAQADLNRLAAVCDLGGGHVRNAVLAAAARARQRADRDEPGSREAKEARRITLPDVAAGLLAEYQKLGRPLPPELARALPDVSDGTDRGGGPTP